MRVSDAPATGRPPDGLGHYLRDVVYGASDGVVTTLAVVAGVAGAGFSMQVGVILGIANLIADGLSMAVSNYLGLKSELEQQNASVDEEQPWRHGIATFAAFVVVGTVPLLAYFVPTAASGRFPVAFAFAAVALAAVGAGRARFVGRPPWRCAVEMVVLAGGAGLVSFVIGAVLSGFR